MNSLIKYINEQYDIISIKLKKKDEETNHLVDIYKSKIDIYIDNYNFFFVSSLKDILINFNCSICVVDWLFFMNFDKEKLLKNIGYISSDKEKCINELEKYLILDICGIIDKYIIDTEYIKVLYFEYIDRGIMDWKLFKTILKTNFPNLKVLIFEQNYSMDDETAFIDFVNLMNLDLLLIDDMQTDVLYKYKPHQNQIKLKNTLIL